jgi:hypothetical protein
MRFFKLIVWMNGAGEKKATAFLLSQEDLVGGIKFEELDLDKAFIDQCSIPYLEGLTSLKFDKISVYDTFVKDAAVPDDKEVKTISAADLHLHIEANKGTTNP